MALNIEGKKAVVEEVSAIIAEAGSIVAAEYRGLSVAQLTELRAKARTANVKVRVVKNTLVRRAVQGTKFEDMADTFVGPLVFAFSGEELGNAARVFKDFAKSNEALVVKSLSIGEGVMDASQLSAVAALPTYDEAVAKLLFVMKEPVAKLARALTAVKEQKEAAAA
ncbi:MULTISPECIES: 50S ribosomal protein L10 [Hydrogenovibrio]|jgi:Ribosomal protein L10|uniref:Large ribosomal subunit protein uL10 n=1 Tax=Hydrogenovibrio marinus TaxID=28885 RepID=A0A066ZQL8_HYDMR|nr:MULTISPECIES: 50S ribosomal protein L10 [Hydrogenovibrio]KDN95782.1 50S ribosomal protein L10 [Hydrogenovibrio marinus]MBN2606712.1 50S ribosomal protein L10 [Thiotrichales bacterium]MPQ77637.1 50S ribosomal protein L10 [Hydrogenovibrio sp. JE_KL2]BBN58734.1 50S ribosomal protein L10 [Hydrogenovibrio marinus]